MPDIGHLMADDTANVVLGPIGSTKIYEVQNYVNFDAVVADGWVVD